jgi:hypothetical protein
MIVASATLVNARLILVGGVEEIWSAKRQYRNANAAMASWPTTL